MIETCGEHGESPSGFVGCPWCQLEAYAEKYAARQAEIDLLRKLLNDPCHFSHRGEICGSCKSCVAIRDYWNHQGVSDE